MPPIRIAVVIASSRVGRATISALLNLHSNDGRIAIRAVLRSAAKGDPSWAARGVEIVDGADPGDAPSLRRAFEGIHRALIVAPQLENRHEVVNCFLDAAKQQGVKHVVLIGGVFQEEEKFLFHRQWMASRRRAQELALGWTQLECSDFMENLLRQGGAVRHERQLQGFSEGCSSPVALADIARAAAAVLSSSEEDLATLHDGKGYHVVGPELLTWHQIAEIMGEVLGEKVQLVEVTAAEAKEKAAHGGAMQQWQLDGFFDWIQIYYLSNKLNGVSSDLPLLGIQPQTLEQWIYENIESFR